jgi:uroporphyrin-III C-methyltransferase/precorrin-2 dehydrogenase/sirohydrochlorin ferrochelatase
MGKSVAASVAVRLMARGLAGSLPVGVVVNAGRRDARLYRGSLGEMASGVADFAEGPAIIFVGAAVAAGDWQQAAGLAAEQFKVA